MTNKLTPEEALSQLKKLKENTPDTEAQHVSADIIVYQLLNFLGQEEVADLYKEMMQDWWYA